MWNLRAKGNQTAAKSRIGVWFSSSPVIGRSEDNFSDFLLKRFRVAATMHKDPTCHFSTQTLLYKYHWIGEVGVAMLLV
jgi:hypothetical protein